ncbi:hypothetical protein [Hyalangium rubrum]|uniref:Pre-toxin TG domain-containing protein n=1 Tax=Hyalangium rubrum TaxID=3103134 RepID=A0ABU5GVE3_9BACT|nr:hypothetical protein [Hyalangium sp. s54d21]MDY7225139.1 hypothetical protein [Hyalangium sp. s54d21]
MTLRTLRRIALVLLSLWGAGCAGGSRYDDGCGFIAGCGQLRAHRRQMRTLQQRRDALTLPNEGTSGAKTPGRSVLGTYLEFLREREEQVQRSKVAEEPRRRERRVLWEMQLWTLRQSDRELRRRTPEEVYREFKVARELQDRHEAERQAAVDAKLEEFFQWGERRWAEVARERVRRVAPRHLLTEHPLRTQSQDALTGAVLDWALTHTRDEDFVRKSPSEVALYLLARRGALATALELGRYAPPHLDYTPPEDHRPPPEELVVELLYGMLPVVGEVTDAAGLLVGYSVTGRELDANERLLCAVGVLVPFVPGRALSGGGELLERAALLTGRSLDEVRVLQRVASHLSPAEAAQVETLVRQAARGQRLSEEDVAFLRRVAAGLEAPLREAAEALRRGGKVPLVGSRLGEAGIRLEPGSAEHMAQAWVDYQFRHPDRYPRFRFDIDGSWRKQYETILKNKEKGTAFEQSVLQARGHEKNRALMMPPPGGTERGFIPDAVSSNPTPGELVWGQPYHFIEVKGRQELALTGNLQAMLDYVTEHGGSIELWIRSKKHPESSTRLTSPLIKRLREMEERGQATVRSFPL